MHLAKLKKIASKGCSMIPYLQHSSKKQNYICCQGMVDSIEAEEEKTKWGSREVGMISDSVGDW